MFFGYRDIQLIENFYSAHDIAHEEAEKNGNEFDCTEISNAFWGSIGSDVQKRANPVEEAVYKHIISRHLLMRNASKWGQQLSFITIENPSEGESEEHYIDRIRQAILDEEHLANMEPDRVSETRKHSPMGESAFDLIINEMMQPNTIEDPNDPDEQEGN